MTVGLLLREFERIADAPDVIAQLRRLVLDLAVRGKLVDQTSADGSGADLLSVARSVCERSSTRESREVRRRSAGDIAGPYELPRTWIWARFGDIARFSAGRTPSRNDLSFWNSRDYPWVSIADMLDGGYVMATKETVSHKAKEQVFKVDPEPPGTMIMSFKLTIGKISRLGVAAYHNEAIISITPWVREMDPYLFLVLPERAQRGATKGAIKGATLNRDSLDALLVPLPPLAEQHRIVAKVDELMALCDQLEAARKEREVKRDGLREASLHRLTSSDGNGTLRAAHIRFFLDRSERLITKPEHVKAVRQTILDLAVKGQLGTSDGNDGPRVGWITLKLSEVLTHLQTGPFGSSLHQSDYVLGGTPVVNPASLVEGRIVPSRTMAVGPETVARLVSFKLRENDIVLARRGEMGRCAVVTSAEHGWLCGTGSLILRFPETIFVSFMALLIGSPAVRGYLGGSAVGSTMQNLNQSILLNLPVSLPPLAEQHRIVAKVHNLMAVCNELEAALGTARDGRRRLLGALSNEAMEVVKVPVSGSGPLHRLRAVGEAHPRAVKGPG